MSNKWLWPGLIILLCALCDSVRAQTPDPNFYIYLCFGQSNSEGAGKPDESDTKNVDPRFRMLAAVDFPHMDRKAGNWYPAIPPLCREGHGLGPDDYFGRTLVANLPSNIRVGVVNVSVSGCKIELFDKDNYQKYVDEQEQKKVKWMTDIIKSYDGNPYAKLVEMGKLAQKDGVIKGMVFHQGESNTGDPTWPGKVKAVYDNLCKDLSLDPAQTPFLAGEVVGVDNHGQCAAHNAVIAKLPDVLPNSYVISSAGCEAGPDHLHFSQAGYRELGQRYGIQMLKIMGVKEIKPVLPPSTQPTP